MPRVLIQAGHHPQAGGAPGEAAWTHKLANLIAERLNAKGVETAVVGDWAASAPPRQVKEDWDLFLALHYDAAIYGARGERNSGCFADRAKLDPMHAESDRFIAIWEGLYPARCEIPLTNGRRNENTWNYYGFRATTDKTPGVIIEHGCGAPTGTQGYPAGEDCHFLHDQIDVVADQDAQAVLTFLGMHQTTLAELAGRPGAADLIHHIRQWQAARRAAGEDPNDWAACRQHILALGAPDPGTLPPVDFPQVSLAEVATRTQNENLASQVREWQDARRQHNEDPNDWAACRRHVQQLGAQDPGDQEPLDFALDPGSTGPEPVEPPAPAQLETAAAHSSLLAPARATAEQALGYLRSRSNGGYSEAEVREIVDLYFQTAVPVGVDPLIAVAQMVHETGFLSSDWSQPPRRNPAGIGVTGEPGAGISFPTWRAAVRAHVGRLLAYAVPPGQETGDQAALIQEALSWRPLPAARRGAAPTLSSLTGTWATDAQYASKVLAHAQKIQQR